MTHDLLEGDSMFSTMSQISLEVLLLKIYGRVYSNKEDTMTTLI